ncbi:MAG: primosomal protein N' [Actinomycetota bacterium]|nr:primosomal protein N' [Actinomycetota bacterium]
MEQEKKYAEVIIDSPSTELDRSFHYSIPEEFKDRIEIGSLILVPFGNRLALAYVVGFPEEPDVKKLRQVSNLLDEPPVFDFTSMQLCRWIAEHYICPLALTFRLMMPPGRGRKINQHVNLAVEKHEAFSMLRKNDPLFEIVEVIDTAGGTLEMETLKKHAGARRAQNAVSALEEKGIVRRKYVLSKPKASPKKRLIVRLKEAESSSFESLPVRQKEIALCLKSLGGAAFAQDLLNETGTSHASIKALEKKGLVEIKSEEIMRTPKIEDELSQERPIPNKHQLQAIQDIEKAIDKEVSMNFLLEGVTGSGKTEVYLECIEKVLSKGRSAIVLVPEISLTPQTLERFESRFSGKVAVLHSRLSPGERFDQWRKIARGDYQVVVGARSAIFAPVKNLGIVVIDEEHETSYKSEIVPRYHARDVARVRARLSEAILLLGSATPSLESIELSRRGTIKRLVLPERIDNRPMPSIEIIDMREVGGAGIMPLLSPRLLDALNRVLEAGDQAILFLNRRGFSNYLQCSSCGEIKKCEFCDVSLCYHSQRNLLLCHHCGNSLKVPEYCSSCGKGPLKGFGAGTQKVESELEKHFPGISSIRMDTDTTKAKDSHAKLIGAFRRSEAQVLIGTQMIAKGLDIPGVTLVGVINADTALALPDFRASERSFQLLTQVSGRAGRGLRPGKVIVQTFNPEHPAIRALTGEFNYFIESELYARKQAFYPPFCKLVNIIITSSEIADAQRAAARLKKILETSLQEKTAKILGPAPAPLSRIKGLYRWHITVKYSNARQTSKAIGFSLRKFNEYSREFPTKSEVKISIDVDPTTLL